MAADMAQAMASMAGLLGSSQAVLEGSLHHGGRQGRPWLNIGSNNRLAVTRPGFTIRAQQAPTETETGRRAMLGLVAAGLATGSFVQAVLADARSIKLGPPPPPSGGLRKSSIILAIPTHLLMVKLSLYLICDGLKNG
ncbi:oxygen-evolving enhancer protein 3, chloroplastic-like [Hibiscus syriacus]|uniref:oxygen-evolving enhancer protein 3, chloroplastic-like n=1 Tax=Hibiscus syriacus TaxID=106335 RepID=UPI001924F4AF|nr:oxygen-evolving enhancer protein 3, chloroplastic-like [Hibiscus syriacus]